MTEAQREQRIQRGIVLAAIEKPRKIAGAYVVSGWFTDGASCACPDHEFTGATCKHMVAATIWQARENASAANTGNVVEQISRPETYEFEIKEGSGLLAEASTPNLRGNADIHVAAYIDGKKVA